jgi:glutamate-ammonia-ligase adenylyltransferase
LVHGRTHPGILKTATFAVFDAAGEADLISAGDTEILQSATRLQHNLTQVLRLCLTGPFDPETASAGLRALLARQGEVPDFAALDAELRDQQQRVQEVVARIIPG